MTAEEEPDLGEQACDKKVRWTFFIAGRLKSQTSAKKENKSVISIKNYIRPWSKRPEKNNAWGNMTGVRPTKMIMERLGRRFF